MKHSPRLLLLGTLTGLLAYVAAAGACGEQIIAGYGHRGLVVGDSVTFGAAGPLVRRAFRVDAVVCRAMPDGLVVLARRRPRRAVVALGSNGTVSWPQLDRARRLTGRLVLVTPRGVGGSRDGDAVTMRRYARWHRRVALVDWARRSSRHPGWFVDGLHLSAAGASAFAWMIAGVR